MKTDYEKSFWVLIVLFGFFIFFAFYSSVNHKRTITFLESKNKVLKGSNDSLEKLIQINDKSFKQKDSVIVILAEKKVKIKYVYNEKIKRIEFLSDSELCKLFDSIFSKNNVSQ